MSHFRARELRKYSTEAERRLWSALRSRRLDNCRFRRQHPIGPFYVDFVCLDLKIVVEADGSHHHDDEQMLYDRRRTKYLERLGFSVVRFDNRAVMRDILGCLDAIHREIVVRLRDRTPKG